MEISHKRKQIPTHKCTEWGHCWFIIVKDNLVDRSLLKCIQSNVNTKARVHSGVQRRENSKGAGLGLWKT